MGASLSAVYKWSVKGEWGFKGEKVKRWKGERVV